VTPLEECGFGHRQTSEQDSGLGQSTIIDTRHPFFATQPLFFVLVDLPSIGGVMSAPMWPLKTCPNPHHKPQSAPHYSEVEDTLEVENVFSQNH